MRMFGFLIVMQLWGYCFLLFLSLMLRLVKNAVTISRTEKHTAVQSMGDQLLFVFHNTSNVRLKLKCRSCFSEFSYNKRALHLSDVEECLKFILRRGNLIAKLRAEVGNQQGSWFFLSDFCLVLNVNEWTITFLFVQSFNLSINSLSYELSIL